MNKGISLYPNLKEQDISMIGYRFTIDGFRYEDSEYRVEDIEYNFNTNNNILLNDKNGSWSIENEGFEISYKLEIKDASILFGPNGIVPIGAHIGIGIKWFSPESLQTSNIEIGHIKHENPKTIIKKKLKFQKGKLRGDLYLEPFLFVKEKAYSVDPNCLHLVNDTGYFLGAFEQTKIILDGEGSIFPFIDIEDEGGPLWRVVCAWDDPNIDKFSKSVAIQLNKKHSDYKYLDINNKRLYNESFVNEIVYNALEIIISKFDLDLLTYSNENEEIGTVAEAVNYWKNTFDINNTSPEKLAYEIRTNIDLGGE